jgi:hypothetical protein
MSKRVKRGNAYRENSAYGKIFDQIRKSKGQVTSREELLEAGFSVADVTVILSPRAEGDCRGDCRGNYSANGHLYYMEKTKGDAKRFRLRWRDPVMEKRVRPVKKEIASKKTQVSSTEVVNSEASKVEA